MTKWEYNIGYDFFVSVGSSNEFRKTFFTYGGFGLDKIDSLVKSEKYQT